MKQTQKTRKVTEKPQQENEEVAVPEKTDLVESIDSVLEEIDLILESNAAEFVNSYVQKGGE